MKIKVNMSFQLFSACLLFCTWLTSVYSFADDVVTNLPPLGGKEGYLLIDLDVKADNATMSCVSIKNPARKYDIELVSTGGRWLVKKIPTGEYQVLNIKVPYFDLPYLKSTEKDEYWRFTVEENKINYFGALKIEKERTENYVEITRRNHLIADLSLIEHDFKEAMSHLSIVSASGFRDDFANESLEWKNKNE
jgi:hypothetical protein